MILSRLALNPLHPRTYKLLADPYLLHQKLCRCYESSRKDADILFRLEPGPILLIQSKTEPDWSRLEEPKGLLQSEQSKPFDPQFAVGQRLAFRLRCRPCKKSKVEGKKNSAFRYLRQEEERAQWLISQGEKKGFALESATETPEPWYDTKPGAGRISLAGARFDGVLVVTDPQKLQEALQSGIGPQKAYGFGLLSLAPIRE